MSVFDTMYEPDQPKVSAMTRAKKKSSAAPAVASESEPEEAPAKPEATKSKNVDPNEFLGTKSCSTATC